MKKFLVLLTGCIAATACLQASTMTYFNSADYVAATVNCQGLSGGQVVWSMTTPRSPASGYTGPTFFGGVIGVEPLAQWRIVNASPDYIQTQDASAAPEAYINQVVMFTNEVPTAWTSVTLRVGGYKTAGTTNWFRLVAQDAVDSSFYITDPVYFSTTFTSTRYPQTLQWYEYDPASSISAFGDPVSWTPNAVSAQGVFQGSMSVTNGLGSALYIFEAYGQGPTGTFSLVTSANNSQWGRVSPTGGLYEAGTTVQITPTASNHYVFSHWTGSLTGSANPGSLTIYADKSVQAVFEPAKHILTVNSQYGTPVPSGMSTNNYGFVLTNTVNSPVLAGLTQYICTGWTLTGNTPASGTTNRCVMTLTNDAVLTWQWITNLLTIPAIGVTPASLSFQFTPGETAPASRTFAVTNTGLGTLHISNTLNVSWMDVQPRTATGLTSGQGATFTVTIFTNGLQLGRSNAVITITDTNAVNSPQTVPVQLDINQEAAPGDWPVYGKDGNRTFGTALSPSFPLAKAWVYKLQEPSPLHTKISNQDQQGRSQFHPVQYDRAPSMISVGPRTYVSSSTEEAVYCLDSATGTNIWTFHTEGAVRLAPTYDNGRIYFGADDGYAYCVSAQNGAQVWKVAATTNAPSRAIINGKLASIWPVRTGIAVEDGKAYFGGGSLPAQGSWISCVDAADGTLLWRKATPYLVQGYILLASNELYIGTGRVAPMQYSKTDGTPFTASYKARREGGGLSLSMMNGDWLVYGPSENGVSYIRISRTPISSYSTAAQPYRIPGEMIPFAAKRVLKDDSRFYFLHHAETSSAWGVSSSILAVDCDTASGILSNSAANFDARYPFCIVNGKSIWWHYGYQKIGALHSEPQMITDMTNSSTWQVAGAPVVSGLLTPSAIIAGGSNIVAAYNPTNGALLWSSAVTGVVHELAFANGALYAGTDAGYVYCFSNGASGAVNETAPVYVSPYSTNDADYAKYNEAAALALANADTTKGYCLVLGAGEGRLAYEIAKRSNFQVIGLETDSAKAAAARSKLVQAGVYGSRVMIHEDMDELFPHPDYFANLIVSEELLMSGNMPYSSREIFRMLQPYGGMVLFGSQTTNLDVSSWVASDLAVSSFTNVSSGIGLTWKKAVRGEPAGFGRWTHQMADPGNTMASGDERVKKTLRLQWTSETNPDMVLDRHTIPGSPLADRGRLFIPGIDRITAVDSYNGVILWEKDLPKYLRQVAMLDAQLMCIEGDLLYIAASNSCHLLNAQSGETRAVVQTPDSGSDWGYVAVYSNKLFGSNQKTNASARTGSSYQLLYVPTASSSWSVVSTRLFAKNPTNGTTLWSYTNGVVLNSSIAIGGSNIFFAVSRNTTAVNDPDGRVKLPDFFASDAALVAVDIETGNTSWELPLSRWATSGAEQAFYLTYAEDRLLQTATFWPVVGSPTDARYFLTLRNPSDGAAIATNAITGGAGGSNNTDHNGVLMRPFVTLGKAWLRTYTSQTLHSYALSNGQYSTRTIATAQGTGTKGCTVPSVSKDTIYYRGYEIDGASLIDGSVRSLTGSTRPGCWPTLLPVGGVLQMPESGSGCSCGNAEQNSTALAPFYSDTQAPSLFNCVALGENTVIVVFDEAVDKTTAENKDNYSINNGVTVTSAVRQTNHLERVTLTVSAMPGGTNTLTVINVKDLHGNALGADQISFESGAADSDGDGLPDSWEQQYFSNPTNAVPSVDTDQDGLTNGEEYIAGTDPTSSSSVLLVDSITPAANNGYVVKWTPQPNRTYSVLWTSNLNASFEAMVSGLAYPQASWTDTVNKAASEGFYRVEVLK